MKKRVTIRALTYRKQNSVIPGLTRNPTARYMASIRCNSCEIAAKAVIPALVTKSHSSSQVSGLVKLA